MIMRLNGIVSFLIFMQGCIDSKNNTETANDAFDSATNNIDSEEPDITWNLSEVSIITEPAYTDSILTAFYQVNAAEDFAPSISYEWRRNGVLIENELEQTLNGDTHFDKGDEIAVTVTVVDDNGYSQSKSSINTLILNSSPTPPTVAIQPNSPSMFDTLICGIVSQPTDNDNDQIDINVRWLVDGTETEITDWTVPFDRTTIGENWTCQALATDGELDSEWGEDTATILDCDTDQDGFNSIGCGGDDCDDSNPAINPDQAEQCDGLDNNCNGDIDEAWLNETFDSQLDPRLKRNNNTGLYNGELSLTPPLGYQSGSVLLDEAIIAETLKASFDFQVKTNNFMCCGDGIALAILDSNDASLLGATSSRLSAIPNASGHILYLKTDDPIGLSLYTAGAFNNFSTPIVNASNLSPFVDNNWHNLELELNQGTLKVFLDSQLTIEETISIPSEETRLIGIAAHTGFLYADQRIDNFQVQCP